LQVRVGSLHFPSIDESQDNARSRFQKAVSDLSAEHSGGLLIVTHGDACGALVEYCNPGSMVYQVDTTGYLVLSRSTIADGTTGGNLQLDNAEGVAWMGD
jgi:broad specificity phosphatase PhoE